MLWGENSIYDREFKDSTSVDLVVMEDLFENVTFTPKLMSTGEQIFEDLGAEFSSWKTDIRMALERGKKGAVGEG